MIFKNLTTKEIVTAVLLFTQYRPTILGIFRPSGTTFTLLKNTANKIKENISLFTKYRPRVYNLFQQYSYILNNPQPLSPITAVYRQLASQTLAFCNEFVKNVRNLYVFKYSPNISCLRGPFPNFRLTCWFSAVVAPTAI